MNKNKLFNLFKLYSVGFFKKEDFLIELQNFHQILKVLSNEEINEIVNYEDNNRTALTEAIHSNEIDILKATLTLPQININYQTQNLNTAIQEAIRQENDEIINYLLTIPTLKLEVKFKLNEGIAFKLAAYNKFDILKDLIENRHLSFDYENRLGHNILHKIAKTENIEMLQYFLNKGININQVSHEPKAPIDIAISQHNFDMINFLIPLLDITKHNHTFKQSIVEFDNKEMQEFMFNSKLCNVASLTQLLEDEIWIHDKNFIKIEQKVKDKLADLKVIEEANLLDNILSNPQFKSKKIKI
jgi:ankyrin repeat protein